MGREPPDAGADDFVRLKNWVALYLTTGEVEGIVTVDPAVFQRIWSQTDGSIVYLTRRALREFADHLEENQPAIEGSIDSGVSPPRWVPPAVVDPLTREEMLAFNQKLLRVARGKPL